MDNKNNIDTKYTLTIIGDKKRKTICLNDFKKSIITFGRNEDNDIVLASPLVSGYHGYFNINNGQLSIFDKKSKNGFLINNLKKSNGTILNDNDTIKIDNPLNPLINGIIMILTVGNSRNVWHEFNLEGKKLVTIGRNNNNDIILNHVSVSAKHAKIVKVKDGYAISPFDSKSGIILNNFDINGQQLLKDKDVLIINNMKLIYNQKKIFFQSVNQGVTLDAINIVKTVKVKRKKKNISQNINFSVGTGEFVAFVGGSGSGKSTFLKCISGITKPTSGKVLLNNIDLFANYDVLKNLIGYVPQDDIVFNDLTLIDMLRYATNLRMPDDSSKKEKEKRVEEVLEIVELSTKKDVMIRNLSGGQRKRACIAVELIADPKIFFLDEPTSGLDPGTERNIMKTLRKMADSGKTIILVTHNTLNLHLCDKVVFFGRDGKVCFDGNPQEALSFFGVDDFTDIYNMIDENLEEWYEKFNSSKPKKVKEDINEEKYSHSRKKSKSFSNHFFTLLKRRLKTLFNNKQQLLLLLGQAPIIGFLMTFVVTDNLFYSYEETKSILFSLSIASIWLGLLNAIQEVCKEKVILKKEFMADLRLSAYIGSKFAYLLLAALGQSLLLTTAFVSTIDVPQSGLIFNWYIEMVAISFITIFSSSSIGLFVSIIAKDSSVASFMPALLVVPQLLFSGIIFPLEGIVEKISNLILGRWSVEAFGTINDLNSLITLVQEKIPGYIRETESFYTFTVEHLTNDVSIIVLMTVILILASYFVLKHQLESSG